MPATQSLLLQSETIFVIISGIAVLAVDSSFITFSKDMEKLWKIALDPYKFPPMRQMHLKYLLSVLVIIRTFSVHIMIALYVVMLWPAIFAEKTYLLMPWIVVATIRLSVDFLATLIGLYICTKYGVLNTLWFEFLLVQLLQHGPFFYIWSTILKFKLHLTEIEEEKQANEGEVYEIKLGKQSRMKLLEARRQALVDLEEKESYTTLTTIIQRISDRKKEKLSTRSLDTLLEIIEKEHQHDDIISMGTERESTEMDDSLRSNIMQKLNITNKDIEAARRNKTNFLNRESVEGSFILSPSDQHTNSVDVESFLRNHSFNPSNNEEENK